jgi:isopenicillin N synthase-like dioxygenase
MEQYYGSSGEKLYNGEKVAEIYPERGYQIGATPEFIEKSRNHCERMQGYTGDDAPLSPCPPEKDAKWRYFWRIGDLPPEEAKSNYEFENLVPEGYAEWTEILDTAGTTMLAAVDTAAEMLSMGLGLPRNLFTDMMKYAPHLLAPTGSDLNKYTEGTIFAGFHYDLNFITIHGKSRFPGLMAWTKNGKRIKVPDGHLLLQAGKMLEHITGGDISAGFHEVLFTPDTAGAVQRAREANRSLWRVSSTLFGHIRSDVLLEPLEKFRNEESVAKYPAINTGDFVMEELKAISLVVEPQVS